jgi:hypothetical protein
VSVIEVSPKGELAVGVIRHFFLSNEPAGYGFAYPLRKLNEITIDALAQGMPRINETIAV